jgi:cell division protein FtsB
VSPQIVSGGLDRENAVLKQRNEELNQENAVLKPENQTLKQRNEALNQENAVLKQRNVGMKRHDVGSKIVLSHIENEVRRLQQENAKLKEEIEGLKRDNARYKSGLSETGNRIPCPKPKSEISYSDMKNSPEMTRNETKHSKHQDVRGDQRVQAVSPTRSHQVLHHRMTPSSISPSSSKPPRPPPKPVQRQQSFPNVLHKQESFPFHGSAAFLIRSLR